MQIEGQIIDLNKIMEAVNDLKDIDKNKVIQQGLRNAGNVFVKRGRANLNSVLKNNSSGKLKSSFKNRVKKTKLGVIAGFDIKKNGSLAHLIDLGTAQRRTKKGANRGKIKASHFWTNAINDGKNEAINKLYNGIERGIIKIMLRN